MSRESNQNKVFQHLSGDGLFIEHLASDAQAKPPLEGEPARDYLSRIVKEAKHEHTTIARHKRERHVPWTACPQGKVPASETCMVAQSNELPAIGMLKTRKHASLT